MADIKQIKVGNTTYNIEPVTSYYKVGRPDFEMNSDGSLKGYGGFIDFHFFNFSGQPLNSSGSVVSSTPDYTSRIIEDSAGCIHINGTYIAWTGLTSGYIKSNGSIDATTFNENGTSLADKYAAKSHTHSSIIDIGDSSKTTTFAYSKSGLNYDDYTWLAGWNGYELRAVNKSQFATSGHTHDGRYLRWAGSAANADAMGWGTLTANNGYTILSHASSSDGGDWGMVNKNGQIFMQLDGYYYQNEGQYRVLDTSDSSSFAAAGHTHSNYVTTNTEQVISGKKTFNNLSANALNTSYISYINNDTGLTIEGPWTSDDTQAILKFVGGKIQGYSHYDDGYGGNDFALDFEFPYGVQMHAGKYSMYLNGSNGCTLTSTSTGWKLAKNDNLGSIYADENNYGRVGTKDHHFYEGYINNIYVNTIYPSSGGAGSTSGYNIGQVGNSSNYFSKGGFKTVYRTSESGVSDIRLKQNINNNDLNALDIINNLNIINFQYDDDIKIEAKNKKQRLKAINTMKELPKTKENKELRKELQKIIATPNNEDMITIGVSAQQLQELLPKKYQKTFIQKESTNQYADQLFIRENRLVYLSFKAIQEQQAIIESLEEKINLLEEKISVLEEKMKKEVN